MRDGTKDVSYTQSGPSIFYPHWQILEEKIKNIINHTQVVKISGTNMKKWKIRISLLEEEFIHFYRGSCNIIEND